MFRLTEKELQDATAYAFDEGKKCQLFDPEAGASDLLTYCGLQDAVESFLPDDLHALWVQYSDRQEDAGDEAEFDQLDDLNAAWDDGCEAAREEIEAQRDAELVAAGREGFRICVFGLPGSNTHCWDVAAPGTADEVMGALWQPGPLGPYESQILTPLEASKHRYQSGASVYGRTWSEISANSKLERGDLGDLVFI